MNRIAMTLALALPLLGGCMGSGGSDKDPQFGTASYQAVMSPEQAQRDYVRRMRDMQKQDERDMRLAEKRCRAERGPDAPCKSLIARTVQ